MCFRKKRVQSMYGVKNEYRCMYAIHTQHGLNNLVYVYVYIYYLHSMVCIHIISRHIQLCVYVYVYGVWCIYEFGYVYVHVCVWYGYMKLCICKVYAIIINTLININTHNLCTPYTSKLSNVKTHEVFLLDSAIN